MTGNFYRNSDKDRLYLKRIDGGRGLRCFEESYIVRIIGLKRHIDEYSMMSHCQGNAKLEYNGGFRAQLQVITFTTGVKETLFYK